MNGMTFGVEGKDERNDSSNGSVLVLESCLMTRALGWGTFGATGGGGGGGTGVSESELLVEENVIRVRLTFGLVDEIGSRTRFCFVFSFRSDRLAYLSTS